MAIYFSKSTNAFYNDAVHEAIPSDKVQIPSDVWQHLITGQSPSSVVSADAAGNPILINPSAGNAVLYTSVGQA